MAYVCNFGFSQEDARTEAVALAIKGKRVFCICSAGDMPLSLLALGASQIVAVDQDMTQIHLAYAKAASLQGLSRSEVIAFLGFMPATPSQRREWWSIIQSHLPEASRQYWQNNYSWIEKGLIWCGKYEQYIQRLQKLMGLVFGRGIKKLIHCHSLAEQEEVFSTHFDRKLLRWLFRIAFHPAIYKRRGIDPKSLAQRTNSAQLGDQFFQALQAFCTSSFAKLNPWLQVHAIGRVLNEDAVPDYLSASAFDYVRKNLNQIEWVHANATEYLFSKTTRTFSAFQLSNLPDWLDEQEFENLLQAVEKNAHEQSSMMWRCLHVHRSLPVQLQPHWTIDVQQGQALQYQDRFPFYRIYPVHRCPNGQLPR